MKIKSIPVKLKETLLQVLYELSAGITEEKDINGLDYSDIKRTVEKTGCPESVVTAVVSASEGIRLGGGELTDEKLDQLIIVFALATNFHLQKSEHDKKAPKPVKSIYEWEEQNKSIVLSCIEKIVREGVENGQPVVIRLIENEQSPLKKKIMMAVYSDIESSSRIDATNKITRTKMDRKNTLYTRVVTRLYHDYLLESELK